MNQPALFAPERIKIADEVSSQKKALEQLAKNLCQNEVGENKLHPENVFDALIQRDKLGSTMLGNGIAFPHACMNIKSPISAALIIKEGIKLETPDKQPVQLFIATLLPEDERESATELLKKTTLALHQGDLLSELLTLSSPEAACALLEQQLLGKQVKAA